jgi:RNA polymerase sigma factor (sigma-70 family)
MLINDINIKNRISFIVYKFKNSLDYYEIMSCVYIAIMNFIKRGKRGNISTYMNRECLNRIRLLNKHNCLQLEYDVVDKEKYSVKDLMEVLDAKQRDIVYKRFWHNMTLTEIGKDYSCSGENIRQILQKSLQIMRSQGVYK